MSNPNHDFNMAAQQRQQAQAQAQQAWVQNTARYAQASASPNLGAGQMNQNNGQGQQQGVGVGQGQGQGSLQGMGLGLGLGIGLGQSAQQANFTGQAGMQLNNGNGGRNGMQGGGMGVGLNGQQGFNNMNVGVNNAQGGLQDANPSAVAAFQRRQQLALQHMQQAQRLQQQAQQMQQGQQQQGTSQQGQQQNDAFASQAAMLLAMQGQQGMQGMHGPQQTMQTVRPNMQQNQNQPGGPQQRQPNQQISQQQQGQQQQQQQQSQSQHAALMQMMQNARATQNLSGQNPQQFQQQVPGGLNMQQFQNMQGAQQQGQASQQQFQQSAQLLQQQSQQPQQQSQAQLQAQVLQNQQRIAAIGGGRNLDPQTVEKLMSHIGVTPEGGYTPEQMQQLTKLFTSPQVQNSIGLNQQRSPSMSNAGQGVVRPTNAPQASPKVRPNAQMQYAGNNTLSAAFPNAGFAQAGQHPQTAQGQQQVRPPINLAMNLAGLDQASRQQAMSIMAATGQQIPQQSQQGQQQAQQQQAKQGGVNMSQMQIPVANQQLQQLMQQAQAQQMLAMNGNQNQGGGNILGSRSDGQSFNGTLTGNQVKSNQSQSSQPGGLGLDTSGNANSAEAYAAQLRALEEQHSRTANAFAASQLMTPQPGQNSSLPQASPRNAHPAQNATLMAQQAYSRAQQAQHAAMTSAQGRIASGQGQAPAQNQGNHSDGLGENCVQAPGDQGNAPAAVPTVAEQQNRTMSQSNPDLTQMSDHQINQYGQVMNKNFMAFKQRAIAILPTLPQDHPHRAAVQNNIQIWQAKRNLLNQECQRRGLRFDFLADSGMRLVSPAQSQAQLQQPGAAQALLNSNMFNAQDLSEDWVQRAQAPDSASQQASILPNASGGQTALIPQQQQQQQPPSQNIPADQLSNQQQHQQFLTQNAPQGSQGAQARVMPTPMSESTMMPRNVFFAQIVKAFQSRGQPIPASEVCGRSFDAYDAYCTVTRFGGTRQVTERKEWIKVAGQLNLLTDGNDMQTNLQIAATLQQYYLNTCVETENAWKAWIVKRNQASQLTEAQRNHLAMQAQSARTAQAGQQATPGQPQQGSGTQQQQSLNTEDIGKALQTLRTAMDIIEAPRLQYLRTEVAKLTPAEIGELGLPPQELLFVRHCISNSQLVDLAIRSFTTQRAGQIDPHAAGGQGNAMAGALQGNSAAGSARNATDAEAQNASLRLRQAYSNSRNPMIAPFDIAENERVQYEDWIRRARIVGSQADQRMASLLLSNGLNVDDDRLKVAVSLTKLLREASRVWRDNQKAILPLAELNKVTTRLGTDLSSWKFSVVVGPAQYPFNSLHSNASQSGATPTQDPGSVKTVAVATPPSSELAPRLRMEDLSLPPAKRAKNNAGSPSVQTPSSPSKSAGQAKKAIKRAPSKRKASTNTAPSDAVFKTPTPVEEKPQPGSVDTTMPPPSLGNNAMSTSNASDNALGVKLGSDAVRARIAEEEQGRQEPIDFLERAMSSVRDMLSQKAVEGPNGSGAGPNALDYDATAMFLDALPTAPAKPWQSYITQPKEEVFDYSFFLDASLLEDEDESTAPPTSKGDMQTPELAQGSTVDPSPQSDKAFTPAPPKGAGDAAAHIRIVSPSIQRSDAFLDDGWLGGDYPTLSNWKWDADNQPASWAMETIT